RLGAGGRRVARGGAGRGRAPRHGARDPRRGTPRRGPGALRRLRVRLRRLRAPGLMALLGLRVPARYAGAACAVLGVVLLMLPGLVWAALGLELVALAFWLWARSLPDRAEQLSRWGWLRRPPMALWLAAALFLALPELRLVFAPVATGPS